MSGVLSSSGSELAGAEWISPRESFGFSVWVCQQSVRDRYLASRASEWVEVGASGGVPQVQWLLAHGTPPAELPAQRPLVGVRDVLDGLRLCAVGY